MSIANLRMTLYGLGALCALAAAAGNVQACGTLEDARFPLHVPDGKRYLEDAAGQPFLLNGDTAWSLIADLPREEADLYLRDRRARGFNTVLVNLIEHRFARNAPANAYGDPPFRIDGDYATANAAYFDHARWVLQRACDLGFLVLLTPSYVGNGGGPEGWYQEMVASGADKMLQYGRFVGERFGDLDNIVWVHGGDYNPPDKDLIRAMVRGIQETDPDALHTAHGSPGSPAIEHWEGEPWLAINNVYTYEPVQVAVLGQYRDGGGLPFFLMESAYENEHGATAWRMRVQAYQALLSGASGHVYGNNPIWHFGGPGIYNAPGTWQDQLDSLGAQSMTVLYQILSETNWWLLDPDVDSELLAGRGLVSAALSSIASLGSDSYDPLPVAAKARDGSFALVYLPKGQAITVDLGAIHGPLISATWRDPFTGRATPVEGSPFEVGGTRIFVPTLGNDAGNTDWLLMLEAEPQGASR